MALTRLPAAAAAIDRCGLVGPRAVLRRSTRQARGKAAAGTPRCAATGALSQYVYNTPGFYKTRRADLESKWGDLGFSIRTVNGHVRYTWANGEWDSGVFVPAPYQLMHINAGALHYGISVFEGLKAFASKDDRVRLMNPALNARRMQRGADALLMPQVPEELFLAGVKEAVRRNREFVPPYGHNASLYVRPLLFASGQMLGLAPLSNEYTFFVTVLPAGGYFGTGSEVGVKAIVSEDNDRAAPRGLGHVKAGGNYAADLAPVHAAHKSGYNTTLYLDATERRYIEEFSVCNFVGITHDGRYVTPASETILESTTNIMLRQLARDRGIVTEVRPIDFEKEIGTFREVGMCGTAAVVVKVNSITHKGHTYEFNEFETIASLRREFLGIQVGEVPDRHGWMLDVCDAVTEHDSASIIPPLKIESHAPGMVDAEEKGAVQELGSEALQGLERHLLDHVVHFAEPGNPDSVLRAMDEFWGKTFQTDHAAFSAHDSPSRKWNVRGQIIEDKVREKAEEILARQEPMRCLELGTYCGYSALRIARNLPPGGTLLSVEKNSLFAAIATKIIEFAGLEDKVKIWMGTVHSELVNITERLQKQPADFVLCDHSKERFIPDMQLLEECGIVNSSTTVVGDMEVFPGDEVLTREVQREISEFFAERASYMAVMF